jgi:hypothetical protein
VLLQQPLVLPGGKVPAGVKHGSQLNCECGWRHVGVQARILDTACPSCSGPCRDEGCEWVSL